MIHRSFWSLLLASTAIAVLVAFRPTIVAGESSTALFADLAVQTLLLAGLPLLWLKLVERRGLPEAGFRLGQPGVWLRWLVPLAALVLPVVLLATRLPSVHAAYPRLDQARAQPWLLVPSTLAFAIYGLSWEFFFRGFMLLGLSRHIRGWAILVQAIPCTLLHIGKPPLEVMAAFPAALLFGTIALRTGSIIPGWLLHLSLALVANLGCVFWPL